MYYFMSHLNFIFNYGLFNFIFNLFMQNKILFVNENKLNSYKQNI